MVTGDTTEPDVEDYEEDAWIVAVFWALLVPVGAMGGIQIYGITERSNFREFSLSDNSEALVSNQIWWLFAEIVDARRALRSDRGFQPPRK